MEDPTDVKNVQKMQSGSYFVLISKEAAQKLGLKRQSKVVEKVEAPNRLIYEVVRMVKP